MAWGVIGRRAALPAALACCATFATVASAPAQAPPDVIVQTCTDPALRQAIDAAQPGATVRFACDGEIVLNPASDSITIFKELTIDGSGRDVTINGNGRMQPFFLSGNTTITMRDLTIRAGRAIDGTNGGGAVYVANTKLVADSVRFIGNSAEPRGGAISVFGAVGALEVIDSEFVGNSTLCSAPECFRGGGGAINVSAGGLTRIESSSFHGNSTAAVAEGGSGGAVQGEFTFSQLLAGPIEIVDSVFEGNRTSNLDLSVDHPAQGGGAVAAYNHSLTIENSRFSDNVATSITGITRGGAVNAGGLIGEPQTQKPVSILDSTFVDNHARGAGGFGGALATAAVPLEIDGSLIEGNSAVTAGGLFAFGPTAILDSRFVGNAAAEGSGEGGAIFAGRPITMSGTDVVESTPDGCFESTPLGEIIDAGDNFEAPGASCAFKPIARPALTVANVSVHEPEPGETGHATFSLTLSRPLVYPLRVVYATKDGTAVAGQDYVASSGELTIPAGATGAQVAVDVLGGAGTEPDETFTLQLSLPEAGRTVLAGGGSGTASILGDSSHPPGPPVGQITVSQTELRRKIEATFRCDRLCDARLELFRKANLLASESQLVEDRGALSTVQFELRRSDVRRLREKVRERGTVKLRVRGTFADADGWTIARVKFRLA